MDIVAISETSESNENSFLSNVKMEGYKLYHTPPISCKGGVALFINDDFDILDRNDLKIQTADFQSIWVEIKMLIVRI